MDAIDIDSLGLLPSRADMSRFVDLKGFAEHAEMLKGMPNGFSMEYAQVKRAVSEAEGYADRFTPNSPEVRARNRYTDIVTLDDTRVRLRTATEGDYVNASFVRAKGRTAPGQPEYIAAQAPLESTAEDFWRMCWENEVPVVAMLTPWAESVGGRMRVKAEPYLPEELGASMELGAFTVRCEEINSEEEARGIMVRKLRLSLGEENRTLYHVHYTHWPDFGSVQNVGLYLCLHACVDRFMALQQRERGAQGPGTLLTHCSAGVGRTGTFVAIDMVLRQIRAAVREGMAASTAAASSSSATGKRTRMPIDLTSVVFTLRDQRPSMVVTVEQYVMIYQVLYYALFRKALQAGSGNASRVQSRSFANDSEVYRHHLRHT